MAVNVIVAAVSALMLWFVAIWLISPHSRAWIEAPKSQPLNWDQERSSPLRDGQSES